MKITIDSENEIKPLVKLVVNDVEVYIEDSSQR